MLRLLQITCLFFLFTPWVQADSQHSAQNSPRFERDNYFGLQTGRFLVEFDHTSGATSPGFVAGHKFDDMFALEGSFKKGSATYETGQLVITNGEADQSNYTRRKLNINVYSAYLVARSSGEWYALAKAGIARADMESKNVVPGIDNTAFSGSIGVGWRLGTKFWLEAEATHIDKNLSHIGITGILHGF